MKSEARQHLREAMGMIRSALAEDSVSLDFELDDSTALSIFSLCAAQDKTPSEVIEEAMEAFVESHGIV